MKMISEFRIVFAFVLLILDLDGSSIGVNGFTCTQIRNYQSQHSERRTCSTKIFQSLYNDNNGILPIYSSSVSSKSRKSVSSTNDMEYEQSYSPPFRMKKFYRGISNIFGVVANVVAKGSIAQELPPLLQDKKGSIFDHEIHVHSQIIEASPQIQSMALVDIEWLKEHEQIVSEERVRKLHDAIIDWDAYRLPLLVDSRSGAILDGHHRFAVGQMMGLSRLPVILVDYLNDDSISVDVWPECGIDCLTKEEVVQMSLSHAVFPPKTSKHDCISLEQIHVPLSQLR